MQKTIICADNVFTGVDNYPKSLCIVINDNYIKNVCDKSKLDEYKEQNYTIVDFEDAFITPGLHDAHQHVFHSALFPSELATEYAGKSEQDCVLHMKRFAKTRPSTGWLVSHGWRDNLWSPAAAPTRKSLDEEFPNRPVAMYSGDAHTLWTNTAGLKALGITNDTIPPEGGSFDRDADGKLTGVLRESAGMYYVAQVLSSFSDSELMTIYKNYFNKLLSYGITSVCDMALSPVPGADGINTHIYEKLLEQNELPVRCRLFPALSDDLTDFEALQNRLKNPLLKATGLKQFFDGVSSQHTAWVHEPYANARSYDDVGRPTISVSRMRSLVMNAASHGYAVRIHTIGDRAVSEAINIFTEALMKYGAPKVGTHTLEHVEDIVPEDIDRLAKTGIVASVQPPHITIDTSQPKRDLGENRAQRMWPLSEMLDAGVCLALGTDSPIVSPSSNDVLYTAITRKNPDTHLPKNGWYPNHNISMAEALSSYTKGSARAAGCENEVGTIEVGKFADLVVWDTNLLDTETENIQKAKPIATYVNGQCVYKR